ncbi:MAG: HEAT repeat domain-containing protein [Candidatus Binatia bacterium]
MKSTLSRIAGLITGPDVEARCAALLVLSHLKAADAGVVRAAGEALNARNAVVRDFGLGYFEKVHPRGGLPYLIPLLDSPEDTLRQRLIPILAQYGASAIARIKKLVQKAPRRRVHAIIDLCGRVHTGPALDVLFGLMPGDDLDVSRAACNAVAAAIPKLDAGRRADLFSRSENLARAAGGARPALVAATKLFGALGDPKARRRLFPLLDHKQHPVVRTHALSALTQCLRAQKLTPAEIDALLALLDESDETGILRPTIRLLEDQLLDRSYLPQLNRLAESPQPVVRRFAVEKLAGVASGATVKTLIGYLTDDSYARRDQATASLKKLPAARLALMKDFVACTDERKAWTLADILLVHERGWKRDTLDALWKRLQEYVEEREDRLYSAYFHFLNALDSDSLAERVHRRVRRLRMKKDFAACAKWLALLKDSPTFDAEAQLALAVAELKSHRHALSATVRRHDPALDILRALARSAFPTVERLRKERHLASEELFYVAFNLAEGPREEQAVGAELLQHLAVTQGRTRIGKAAKNKLRLVRRST